jgi:DNA primase
MEMEQMSYVEALKHLAKKYGIPVEEEEMTDEQRQRMNERESMFAVNEWAAKYFSQTMMNNQDGRAIGLVYFRSRGFRDDIIAKFRLGFCLDAPTAMSDEAKAKGYNEKYLIDTGLCVKRDNGTIYDRFRGRAMFPWIAVNGKVVAFGGRVLDARTKGVNQKYVNSPDSIIYHKANELYGIFQAKKQIAKEDRVFMVEGYTDVIAMHQCGIENVVANSGTALSMHQIKMLRRFTQNITLLYDGDEAGIHAAMRGTDMLLSEGMNVKVLILPDGDDPDSFARKHTASDFRQYIEDHQTDFIQFKSDLLLRGVTDPIKRSEAINNIVRSLAVITDPIVRDTYVTDCARRIGISEATLIAQMNKFIHSNLEQQQKDAQRETERQQRQTADTDTQPTQQPLTPATPSQQASQVETMLLQMIVRHGGDVIFNNVETDDGQTIDRLTVAQYICYSLAADSLSLGNELYNQMMNEAAAKAEHHDHFDAAQYFAHHSDYRIAQLAAELSIDHFQLSKSQLPRQDSDTLREQTVRLLLDFRLDYADARLKQLQRDISLAANDTSRLMQLMEQYQQMQTIRNALAKKLGNNIVV